MADTRHFLTFLVEAEEAVEEVVEEVVEEAVEEADDLAADLADDLADDLAVPLADVRVSVAAPGRSRRRRPRRLVLACRW